MKKLTKKELKDIPSMVDEYRDKGMTDQEIYQELRKMSDQRWTIFKIINGTAQKYLRKKYKALNFILVTLLVITAILKFIGIISLLSIDSDSPWLFISIVATIAGAIPLYFGILIYNYRGYAYKVLGIFCLVSLFNHRTYSGGLADIYFNVSMILLIGCLSLYLANRMFPSLKLFFVKANKEGEYYDHLITTTK